MGDFTSSMFGQGAMIGEYLGTRLKPGDKVIVYSAPYVTVHQQRYAGAKPPLEWYKLEIIEMQFTPGSQDPKVACREAVRSALLADTEKKIKGLVTFWDGFGIEAARACDEAGRNDVLVTWTDDYPNTYDEMRRLPAMAAAAGFCYLHNNITNMMFGLLENIFAGKPVESEKVYMVGSYFFTRDDLPPRGYFYSYQGYDRPKDWEPVAK
jgi:ABC-type sugar transport system substrate-binding protein